MAEQESQFKPKLSRLDLHGFKSFATKTTFQFEPGITAIVGPNGSGKSNIADAVRWVLGETSHSALRSKKTEDVIFAGGRGKPPSGMAEVTVTFDNEDHWLPSEFAEVTVTRRAFRGGGGEYLINGRKVRLKDVARLVASLGQSYTVVGQGLVDAALSQRAEDRRGLFEHAADLTGLRLRVAEGERNLAETDTNVTRLTDLLSQVEPNLKRLERAAKQQREWKELREHQLFLQRGHYRRLLETARANMTEAETNAAYDQNAMAEAQSELDQLIAARPGLEQALQQATNELERHDARLGELREQLNDVSHRKELVEERLAALDRRSTDAEATRAALLEQIESTEKRIGTSDAALSDLTAEIETAREAVQQQESTANLARSERQEAEQALAKCSHEALQLERKVADAQQKRALLIQRKETSAADTERLTAESKERENRLQTLSAELAEHEHTDKSLTDQIAALDANLAELQQEIEAATESSRASLEEQAQVERDLAQASHRMEILQRMHESGEGLFQGPRNVVQWHSAGKLSGIRGTLAELIEVDKKYDRALETALGGHLQDIVVDAWKDAEAAIQMLKQSRAGRATFQPIETVRRRGGHRSPPREIEGAAGVHGIASDLVDSDPDVADVVRGLLGRFVVVEDLDTSRRLLDSLPGGWSTVTLAGEITRSGGSVTGGSQGRDSGMLSRERELRELPDRISALEQKREAINQDVAAKNLKVQELQQQRSDVGSQRADLSAQLKALVPQRNRLQGWIADVQKQQAAAAQQQQAAALTSDDREKEISSLVSEIDAGKERIESLRDQEAELTARLATHRDSASEQNESLSNANSQLAALEERVRAEERQRSQWQSQLRAQQTELQNRQNDEAEMEGRRLALADELERLKAEEQRLGESVESGDTARKPLADAMGDAANKLQAQQKQIETSRQTTMERERSFGQKELQLERVRAELSSVHQRIVDDLNYEDPDDLLADTEEHDFSELPDDYDAVERELTRLRNRLHRVGYVGDNVVEEYEQEAERYAFLTEQLADVQQAAARLREMLAELHDTMQTRFEETFEQVSLAFSEAFTVLFGGGQARLVLTADEDGTPGGVDIVAQPPGKRLQGLALLSGGERSLTGVALLFAILRVNPSPFVLLDEVDAALDEANVVRFRDELRKLANETQAIVVTHNRGTVEIADTLYGITMGGDGVSQTLSLRMDDLPIDEEFDVRDLPAVSTGIPVR